MDSLSEHEGLDTFAAWLATPLGAYVLARERQFFDRAVADVFGYYAVQCGLPTHDFLVANRIPTRLHLGQDVGVDLHCDPAALPLSAASIDLLILPHTLDFHPDPHAVLREAERVLVPDGKLMLTGFNPWSLWGLTRQVKRKRGTPWCGNFLGLSRVKDWLALLSLEPSSSCIRCYAPPFSRTRWLDNSRLVEFAGDRWWPVGGAIYCIASVKRVRGMRLIAPRWKQPRKVRRAVAVASVEQAVAPSNEQRD